MTGLFKVAFFIMLFLHLLFFSSPAIPAIVSDWINVETNNDTHFLVNLNVMEKEENTISYTLRILRSDNSFSDAKLLIDCRQKKHTIIALSEFSDSGKLVARYDNSSYLIDIKAEKVFGLLFLASCDNSKARIPVLETKENKTELPN
ncbi:MAG: hypothetical protein HQL10_07230 [Nitrospirae bacterium]|nr:hypothetical protein [Nitrospirota bacterium]